MTEQDRLKQLAAVQAAALVESGMRLGLGSGSTSVHAIREIGRRLAAGEVQDIVGVATSEASARLASGLGIPVEPLDPRPLDLAIDGADEIDPQLNLIKGLGGALTREKLVEVQAREFVVVADHSKLVARLGQKTGVPVEVVPFGHLSTLKRLESLGAQGRWRMAGSELYLTDNGNHIYDAHFADIPDPTALAVTLKGTLGVVETGLFVGMAQRAYVATPDGVRELSA